MCLIPALLLVAITCRVLAAWLQPRHRLFAAIGLLAGFIVISNTIRPLPFADRHWSSLSPLIAYLQTTDIPSNTRIYASPNEQFVLTFYTGMGIQNIAPVRKSWLDHYPGHILFIERIAEAKTTDFTPDALQRAARKSGKQISRGQAWNTYCDVLSRDARIDVAQHVKEVLPPVSEVSAYASDLLAQYKREAEEERQYWSRTLSSSNPILKHRPVYTHRDWWTAFFYGLVDYDRRRSHPNWEDRFRNATAESLRCAGWMIYRS